MKTTRQLWIVSSTLFLSMVGFGLTLPALPFYVERLALGAAPESGRIAFHVGMLTSAYALSQLVLAPFLGAWSDRHGRKPFLVVGLLGFALAQLLFGLGTSLPVLYAARLGGGAAAAALLTASSAVVADLLEGRRRTRGMAWKGTAGSLGVVVGPAMSGLLTRSDMHGHRMVGHFMLDGFSVPFFVAAALALVAVVPVVFMLNESVRSTAEPPPSDMPSKLSDLLVLSGVAQLSLASFEAIFALYGRDSLSLSIAEIGWGFATCGGVMAVFQGLFVSWVGPRIPLHIQLSVGFFALGLGTALLGSSTTLAPVLSSIAILALGIAIISPNLVTAVADRRSTAVGSALGLQNTANGVGQVLGPAAGSVVYAVNARAPFFLTAGVAIGVSGWLLLGGARDATSAEVGGGP